MAHQLSVARPMKSNLRSHCAELFVLTLLGMMANIASGAVLEISSPTSESAYHAGDEVAVAWFYEGTAEKFQITLQKQGKDVADLCENEENGVCYDLTQDQTVVLPEDLESGSDYTITVEDNDTGDSHVSDPFTVIGDTDVNIEITSPDGTSSFEAGEQIEVEWLYVGDNQLFDIYVRQGDGDLSVRVSENLCAGESSGSCLGSNVGSATVTIPAELADGSDYTLLVVDTEDDDAYGISVSLSVGIELSSEINEGFSTGTSLAIVIGACAGGICLVALLMAVMRRRKKEKLREEKLATLDMMQKRRRAPSVALAVEDMALPDTPQGKSGICVRLSLCLPKKWRSRSLVESPRGTGTPQDEGKSPDRGDPMC